MAFFTSTPIKNKLFENLTKRQREETRTNVEQYNQYEAKSSENGPENAGASKLSFDQWLENKKKNEKTLNRLIKKMQKDEMKKTEDKHKRNLTYEDWMVKKEEDDLNKWRKARDEARKRRTEIEKEQKMKEQLKKTEELEKQKKEEDMKIKEEQLKQLQEDQKALLSNQASVQASETEDSSSKIVMKEEETTINEPIEATHQIEKPSEPEIKVSEELSAFEPDQDPESEIIVKIESEVHVPGAPKPIALDSVTGEKSLLIDENEDKIDKTDDNQEIETATGDGSMDVAETELKSNVESEKEQSQVQEQSSEIENSNQIPTEIMKQEIDKKVEPKTDPQVEVEVTDSKPSKNPVREKSNLGQFIPHGDQVQKEDSPSRNVFNADKHFRLLNLIFHP